MLSCIEKSYPVSDNDKHLLNDLGIPIHVEAGAKSVIASLPKAILQSPSRLSIEISSRLKLTNRDAFSLRDRLINTVSIDKRLFDRSSGSSIVAPEYASLRLSEFNFGVITVESDYESAFVQQAILSKVPVILAGPTFPPKLQELAAQYNILVIEFPFVFSRIQNGESLLAAIQDSEDALAAAVKYVSEGVLLDKLENQYSGIIHIDSTSFDALAKTHKVFVYELVKSLHLQGHFKCRLVGWQNDIESLKTAIKKKGGSLFRDNSKQAIEIDRPN